MSAGRPHGLRRIDARFLLPAFPETAAVLHPEWVDGLRQVGVRIVQPGDGPPPDLVVAPTERGDEALRLGARMVLLDGRARGPLLTRSGPGIRRYLAVPDTATPMLLADLSHGRAADEALAVGTYGGSVRALAKRNAARALVRLGLLPTSVPMYSVHAAPPTTPALVRAAAVHAGVAVDGWFLLVEPGPDDKRCVFFLVTGAHRPHLVVKFPRVADDRRKARREARGLEAAQAAGAIVTAHAPRLVCEFEVGGHHATVQTAAAGQTLTRRLVSPRPRRHKLSQLEGIATWLREVARTTARRRSVLDDDVRDLAARSCSGDDAAHLLAVAESSPAVFQHGDLTDGNVLVDGSSFVVVDWELAGHEGFPLWDLVKLAVSVLPTLDGARNEEEHTRRLRDLFRGRAASSPVFFRWLRDTADACGLQRDAVPEIVTLCLLWYSTLHSRMHPEALPAGGTGWAPLEQFTAEWLADPGLGLAWRLWRDG